MDEGDNGSQRRAPVWYCGTKYLSFLPPARSARDVLRLTLVFRVSQLDRSQNSLSFFSAAMVFRPTAALQQLLIVTALLCASLLRTCTVHGAASNSESTTRFWRPLSAAPAAATEADEQAERDGTNNDPRHHACAFFLWDVPSLIQYKLCEHLLRQNVYEAKGGKKMVRIRPGSALEYLYPLSRHAPDRCALCGHTFEDHLRRWWAKKGGVGTAYDRLLDATYDEGVSVVYLGTSAGGAGAGNENKKSFPVYSFHRRYVEDLPKEDQYQPLLSRRKKRVRRSKEVQKSKAGLFDDDDDDEDDDEYEKYTRGPVPYRIPRFSPKGMGSLWKALGLLLARNMAMDEVDKLIDLETKENQLLERRASMF